MPKGWHVSDFGAKKWFWDFKSVRFGTLLVYRWSSFIDSLIRGFIGVRREVLRLGLELYVLDCFSERRKRRGFGRGKGSASGQMGGRRIPKSLKRFEKSFKILKIRISRSGFYFGKVLVPFGLHFGIILELF